MAIKDKILAINDKQMKIIKLLLKEAKENVTQADRKIKGGYDKKAHQVLDKRQKEYKKIKSSTQISLKHCQQLEETQKKYRQSLQNLNSTKQKVKLAKQKLGELRKINHKK